MKNLSKRERARRDSRVESLLDRITDLAKEKAAVGAFPPLDAPGAEDIFRESVRDVAEALAAGRGESLTDMLKSLLVDLHTAKKGWERLKG